MADRTVYVGNISAGVDEFTLRSIFENCGFVTQVRIAGKRGLNTIYAFVEFADPSQAYAALAMNGLQLGDRQIRCSMAKTLPQGGRSGSAYADPTAQLAALQAQAQARLVELGYGRLAPAWTASAMLPVAGLPATAGLDWQALAQPAQGKKPYQDPDKVLRTVFVENVDPTLNEKFLAEYFAACGQVTAMRIADSSPGQPRKAWVEFATAEAARTAQGYDNAMLGPVPIRVRPSRTAIHTNLLVNGALLSPQQLQQQRLLEAAAQAQQRVQAGLQAQATTAQPPASAAAVSTADEPQQPLQQAAQQGDQQQSPARAAAARSPPSARSAPAAATTTGQQDESREQQSAPAVMHTDQGQQSSQPAADVESSAAHSGHTPPPAAESTQAGDAVSVQADPVPSSAQAGAVGAESAQAGSAAAEAEPLPGLSPAGPAVDSESVQAGESALGLPAEPAPGPAPAGAASAAEHSPSHSRSNSVQATAGKRTLVEASVATEGLEEHLDPKRAKLAEA